MLTSQTVSQDADASVCSGVAETGAKFTLTPREVQTLDLMTKGFSNPLIGTALGVSAHTAKFHVMNVLKKLDADNRAHAVAMAMRMGIVK